MYEIENGHKVPKQRRKAGSEPPAVKKAFNEYAPGVSRFYRRS